MSKPVYRILTTGSRRIEHQHGTEVRQVLAAACGRPLAAEMRVEVLEGRCPYGGVDLVVQRWCEDARKRGLDIVNVGFPANWDTEGSHAGPARNQRMVDTHPNLCLAFPTIDSRGTWDCIRKAAAAGIRVNIYPLMPVKP